VRIAVISDIHGNLHALEAVLESIDTEAPDAIWCLGDLVGYGPRPNRCTALVQERAAVCLAGNHDLAATGRVDLEVFVQDAAVSARWTADVLEPEPRSFLNSLEPQAVEDGIGLYHASPRDPVWEYVLSPDAALGAFTAVQWPLLLVGHSHVALSLALTPAGIEGGIAPAGTEVDLSQHERWLLNPGSVGQPRDSDPRAAYLLIDFERLRAVFHRVAYPVGRTQTEMRERRLPEALVARLSHGV
jgi:predicted phosphodiesterase